MTDHDLPARLEALAETLVGDEWSHPIDSVEICRRAAKVIRGLIAEGDGSGCGDGKADIVAGGVTP